MKLGRPAVGKGLQFNSSFRPELAAKIDAWVDSQSEPKPSLSEAIRRLVEKGLEAEGGVGTIARGSEREQ